MINIFDQLHVVGINCKLFNMDFVFFFAMYCDTEKKNCFEYKIYI